MCDHAASLMTSVNADLSTALKCLTLDEKQWSDWTPAIISARAATSLLFLHTSCILLCTILWYYLSGWWLRVLNQM